MNILITGVGPHNKGAELMLLAILDQLRRRLPEARPVISPAGSPYSWRAELGLHQLLDREQSGRMGWLRERLFHEGYRARFGMVTPEEIDVVLDASGYAFGDTWQPEHVEHAASQFERYRKLGARIVLLSQAFGPFSKPRVRTASTRLLNAADLVFARDPESLMHCMDIAPDHTSIHRAPDFTNLIDGILPDSWTPDPRHVALVPNSQMLRQTTSETARNYVPAFAAAARTIGAAGYHPFILVHEGNDPDLAAEIASASGVQCPVVHEQGALAIKGILGRCAFTLGSRFHGLVSALSQGVPSIGTTWSHKYRYLFEDFQIPEYLVPLHGGHAELLRRVGEFFEPGHREEIASKIKLRNETLRQDAERQWSTVLLMLRAA